MRVFSSSSSIFFYLKIIYFILNYSLKFKRTNPKYLITDVNKIIQNLMNLFGDSL